MTTDNPTRSRIIADTIRPHMDAWFPGTDPEARETMSAEAFKTALEAVAAAAYDRTGTRALSIDITDLLGRSELRCDALVAALWSLRDHVCHGETQMNDDHLYAFVAMLEHQLREIKDALHIAGSVS